MHFLNLFFLQLCIIFGKIKDCADAYTYPVESLNKLLNIELVHNINAGLYYISKRDFSGNIDLVESYFKKVSELGFDDMSHLEQTLVAILLSKAHAVPLGNDYQILERPVTEQTVCHHFAGGSRINFYLVGLQYLKAKNFLRELKEAILQR